MSGSTIPAAWQALYALWAGLNIPNLQVTKGPVYDPKDQLLAIGWDRTDQPAIQFTKTPMTRAGGPSMEEYEISSLLSFAYGKKQIDTVITSLFDVYAQLDAAVTASPTLNGSVLEAWTSSGDVTSWLIEQGTLLDLRISVHVKAAK